MKNIWYSRAGSVRRPYGHRTGSMWIMRIIWSKHKCTAVSSRKGPVAWCDYDNNTGVKFLRVLHSALRARNRTGVKNRTGPMVGCDWGIRQRDDCLCTGRINSTHTIITHYRTASFKSDLLKKPSMHGLGNILIYDDKNRQWQRLVRIDIGIKVIP